MTPASEPSSTLPDAANLDHLHDIITAPPVSWWPPANGWIVLAGLVVLLLAGAMMLYILRRRQNLYRRQAITALQQIQPRLQSSISRSAAICSLAVLLKRVALSVYPRDQVASLTGSRWIDFLRQTGGSFSDRTAYLLTASTYDPQTAQAASDGDVRELASAAQSWIAHHRVPPANGKAE